MGGLMLSPAEEPTATTINGWLAENGSPWAERVRAIYGTDADDCIEMILGGVA